MKVTQVTGALIASTLAAGASLFGSILDYSSTQTPPVEAVDVQGKVFDVFRSGVEGATVTIGGRSTDTNANGDFWIPSIAPQEKKQIKVAIDSQQYYQQMEVDILYPPKRVDLEMEPKIEGIGVAANSPGVNLTVYINNPSSELVGQLTVQILGVDNATAFVEPLSDPKFIDIRIPGEHKSAFHLDTIPIQIEPEARIIKAHITLNDKDNNGTILSDEDLTVKREIGG